MSLIRLACARLASLVGRRRLDADFDDEALSHLTLAIEDYVQHGMGRDEAERLARLKFGPVVASREAYQDARGVPWLEELLYDLRVIVRGLLRDRGFTVAVVATLAIAVALNTTVFTIVQAMLFRGLPLAVESDRLVYVDVRRPLGPPGIAFDEFEQWRAQAQAFEGMAFVGDARSVTYRDNEAPPVDMVVRRVTANMFGLLGVRPYLGRDFTAADAAPGAPPVAVLSHTFWTRRFGQRADIVGTIAYLDATPVTIIGVMPQRFVLVYEQDLWMPLTPATSLNRKTPSFAIVIGRLREHATIQQAQTELATIDRRLAAIDPTTDRTIAPLALTYAETFVAEEAPDIYGALWVGAAFVLLIACANVTNLSLVRMTGRWRNFATRMALGAGQWRLLRQIVIESVMLITIAGAIGWLATVWTVPRWAAATASPYVALDYTIGLDVFGYLVAVCVLAVMLSVAAPAIRLLQLGAGGALRGDARGVTHSLRSRHLTTTLVVTQVALALVLLAGAGVLVRSLISVVRAETGVRAQDQVLVGAVRLPAGKYLSAESGHAYFERLAEQLRAVAGVEALSLSNSLPVLGGGPQRRVEIEGQVIPESDRASIRVLTAGPDYFRVMATPPLAGREFTRRDDARAQPVAIVNERFAAMVWPTEQPVGKRLRFARTSKPAAWLTVVGVVPNIKQGDPVRQQFNPIVYLPFAQEPSTFATNSTRGCCFRGANILIRSRADHDVLASALRVAVRVVDPEVAVEELMSFEDTLGFSRDFTDMAHAELGKHAAIAPVYAVIALLLAGIGLYAVIAHSVGQRTSEIGVRMVVGATSGDIRRLVFREGMLPVVVGLMSGLVLSLAVNGVLRSQLVSVSPSDPTTLAAALALLILVALLACYVPSRRALRVEPSVALRQD